MTFRRSNCTSFAAGSVTPTKVESWKVQLAAKNGMFFAKIAGTSVLYSGDMQQVSQLLANYDKTFSRPYTVVSSTVTSPHSNKPIKGALASTLEDAECLRMLVENIRSQKKLGSMKRDEPADPWKKAGFEPIKPREENEDIVSVMQQRAALWRPW